MQKQQKNIQIDRMFSKGFNICKINGKIKLRERNEMIEIFDIR